MLPHHRACYSHAIGFLGWPHSSQATPTRERFEVVATRRVVGALAHTGLAYLPPPTPGSGRPAAVFIGAKGQSAHNGLLPGSKLVKDGQATLPTQTEQPPTPTVRALLSLVSMSSTPPASSLHVLQTASLLIDRDGPQGDDHNDIKYNYKEHSRYIGDI